MKKFKYVLFILICMLFVPRVYALSYDIITANDISVKKGAEIQIGVAIENVKDTSDGISVCTMNISFDKNIELESSPRTLENWTMTTGSIYLFDTGVPVFDKSDIFIIPVKVNGDGYVKLSDVVCSDGIEEVEIEDRTINFYIEEEKNDMPDTNKPSENKPDEKKSNCNLSNIELSEGSIEFDPNVTEYEVKIRNFNDFRVTPKLEDSTSSYVVDKLITDEGGTVVITVNGADGNFKAYTIYTIVDEVDNDVETPKKNNYIPIFIGVIVLLVLINIIRVVKNTKKK